MCYAGRWRSTAMIVLPLLKNSGKLYRYVRRNCAYRILQLALRSLFLKGYHHCFCGLCVIAAGGVSKIVCIYSENQAIKASDRTESSFFDAGGSCACGVNLWEHLWSG